MLKRQAGYSLIEITIGVVIVFLLTSIALSYASDFFHRFKIDRSADDLSKVVTAVQRRNAHDGFLFSFWDENGGLAPTNDTLSWAEGAEFTELLNNYLVGRDNTQCGQGANGWNPVNTDGGPDAGAPTLMERAALVPCNQLRDQLPWRLDASAALSPDVTGAVGVFTLYLDHQNAYFGSKDNPDNNILNLALLRNALEGKLTDGINGVPRVTFARVNDLNDIEDDVVLTSRECEADLANCVIAAYIDFQGTTNGMFKRTDNQDFMLDDLTFGSSVAGGRQKCAFWTEAGGVWSSVETDCGIKGGSGDTSVTLVVDSTQTGSIRITDSDSGAPVTHTCKLFEAQNRTPGSTNMTLVQQAAPNAVSPCGFTKNGNIVQLMTDEAHVGTVYGNEIVANMIFGAQTTLYSSDANASILRVRDSSNTSYAFEVSNNGNTRMIGDLSVEGNANIEGDIAVSKNGRFLMQDNGTLELGIVSSDPSSLRFSRNTNTFIMESTGIDFKVIAESRLSLGAPDGVIMENNTNIHASRSTLTGDLFNPTSGIDTDALKARSSLVTADMAKYLDDTSSPIQTVGIDRIEGEFATLTKPNCLAFADDDNFSAGANPYIDVLSDAQRNDPTVGQSLARLVLVPIFMKTYNSAFGDNQIYSQHGVHSSPSTWDIYLYLSGEGAFGTGGREDGAGASLAMSICDYSSINFSGQSF